MWDNSFSTVGEYLQHCRCCSVQCGGGDNISAVGDSWKVFSTLGGYLQYMRGIAPVQWVITSVLWRVFSTVGKIFNFGMFGH